MPVEFEFIGAGLDEGVDIAEEFDMAGSRT